MEVHNIPLYRKLIALGVDPVYDEDYDYDGWGDYGTFKALAFPENCHCDGCKQLFKDLLVAGYVLAGVSLPSDQRAIAKQTWNYDESWEAKAGLHANLTKLFRYSTWPLSKKNVNVDIAFKKINRFLQIIPIPNPSNVYYFLEEIEREHDASVEVTELTRKLGYALRKIRSLPDVAEKLKSAVCDTWKEGKVRARRNGITRF